MNKVSLVFTWVVLTGLTLCAQINESDTASFQMQLRSGGSFQSGNVEVLRVTSQMDLSAHLSEDLVFKTQNNHLYQKIFGTKADDDLISRNYVYFHPEKRIYPYIIGFISTNFRREINLRTFYGAGFTYQILMKPEHSIKLSSNLLHEQSDFENDMFNYDSFDGNNPVSAFWTTLYLSGFNIFKESSLKLFYELYWQQSIENRVNYRYHAIVGFDQKIVKGLSVQSRCIYAFENLTATGVKQSDLLWTWGLAYAIKTKGNNKQQ